jgi:hypothetical protein
MGNSTWSGDAWKNISSNNQQQSTNQIFTQNVKKTVANDMDPKGIVFRESRDSVLHPETLAIAIFLDETGSMGHIPEDIVKNRLGSLMETLIKHGLPDGQVMFCGIGDERCDQYPLQISQFESGTDELNKWLGSLYLEGNGGGNGGESYLLSWYFAARHTSIDCFEKRDQKGLLFTIGDEPNHQTLSGSKISALMGLSEPVADMSADELLAEVQKTYNVFHIHLNHGNYGNIDTVAEGWKRKLGERVIVLSDYTEIAELIASTCAIVHGADLDAVVADFDSKTALNIKTALTVVNQTLQKTNTKAGVITL